MCSADCLIHLYICILFGSKRWHWQEHSPPTNVTLVQIWASTPSPCGLLLLMVLFFSPRGFSLGSVVFPSPQKPTIPNSNSTTNQVHVHEEPPCGYATSKSLFIYSCVYLSIYLFIFIYLFIYLIPYLHNHTAQFASKWSGATLRVEFEQILL